MATGSVISVIRLRRCKILIPTLAQGAAIMTLSMNPAVANTADGYQLKKKLITNILITEVVNLRGLSF